MTNTETQELELRIEALEEYIYRLDQDLQNMALMNHELMRMVKDTQTYTIKLASVQDRLNKYISHWPFVRVDRAE